MLNISFYYILKTNVKKELYICTNINIYRNRLCFVSKGFHFPILALHETKWMEIPETI